jgi:hypothetical protein
MNRLLAGALALCAATAGVAQEATQPVTAAEIFAEARKLAGKDKALLAEIARAQAENTKGVLGNAPVAVRQVIPGGKSWALAMTRRPGEPLTIAVRRIGAAPVTLHVADAQGQPLCADTTPSATLSCRIAPGEGAVAVRVTNPGTAATEAMVVTN